jgi:anti-sigma B factor antagonist
MPVVSIAVEPNNHLDIRSHFMPTCDVLTVWKSEDVHVVRFDGRQVLDIVTADGIGDELYDLIDQPDCQNLLLNFSGIVGLSSVMLGKLLVVRMKRQCKRGQVKVCTIGPEVYEVFSETKLGQIIDIRESEAEALEAFSTGCTASAMLCSEST